MADFKQRPDSGRLMSVDSKRSEKSPDYWGEIAINPKDMTNVRVEDGLWVIRLSGWKRRQQNGKAYLSIAVDRYERQAAAAPAKKQEDDDVDF